MEITWYITDGHGDWEQHEQETVVPDRKLDKCKTQAEKQELIERLIERDFRRLVSWRVSNEDSDKVYV